MRATILCFRHQTALKQESGGCGWKVKTRQELVCLDSASDPFDLAFTEQCTCGSRSLKVPHLRPTFAYLTCTCTHVLVAPALSAARTMPVRSNTPARNRQAIIPSYPNPIPFPQRRTRSRSPDRWYGETQPYRAREDYEYYGRYDMRRRQSRDLFGPSWDGARAWRRQSPDRNPDRAVPIGGPSRARSPPRQSRAPQLRSSTRGRNGLSATFITSF